MSFDNQPLQRKLIRKFRLKLQSGYFLALKALKVKVNLFFASIKSLFWNSYKYKKVFHLKLWHKFNFSH